MAAAVLLSLSVASANAANLLVDDDKVECPAAGFTSVQAAVDAAAAGDTVVICAGDYVEGSGHVGTSSVTIDKEIDIKGAGADLVSIMPKRNPSIGGRIASGTPKLRDGLGNIVTVIAGNPLDPGEVNISGITVEGNGVFAETGILFLDSYGSIVRSRVTDIVTSEQAGAFGIPGAFRGSDTGYGIVQATAATAPIVGAEASRPLLIESSRVDKYNKTGILIDSAINDTPPLTAAGVSNDASIVGSTVVGRLRCIDYNINGNCSNPGTVTTGPLFGQDGLRVTAGSSVSMDSSSIFQNYVNGVGAPEFSPNQGAPLATNNANLSMAAGVRLIGADASTIIRSNIADNHFGAFNVALDGTTANTATPLSAEGNWWGIRTTGTTVNTGPAVSPVNNPAQQENPVNGAEIVDATCVAASFASPTPAPDVTVPGSDAVDFCPYRNGARSSSTGQVAIPDAPIPVSDAGPTVSLSFDKASYAPGETATLTADPEDDFAIKGVTFYDGPDAIGTASTAPYEIKIPIAADAACETTSYGVVAEDSLGQTESDSADLTVADPVNNCEPLPGPAPTITLDVPAQTPSSGSTATATINAEEGVASVNFFIGTRQVCSVTAEPYTCSILPTGADVGGQSIRAVVTDVPGRSAEASNNTVVAKFSTSLSLKAKKSGAAKRVVSGKIKLPNRVTKAQACASGSVTLKVSGGGRPTINRQVKVSSSCAFKTTVGVGKPPKAKKGKKPKKRKFTVKANYSGNSVLKSANNSRRFS